MTAEIGSNAAMDRGELERLLGRFEIQLNEAGLKPTAVFSYVDYAGRFIRWLCGDYRPRNAPGLPSRPTRRSWGIEQLRSDLVPYEAELRAARLRPSAIHTYTHGASVFVRWLAGEYAPTKSVRADGSLLTPNELAQELGLPGITVRNYLRARYPRRDDERYARWQLTAEQAADVRRALGTARSGDAPERRQERHGEAPADWFWEGNVQDVVVRELTANGWHVERAANTAMRARGHDIEARRNGQRLIIEVKGYPSDHYRDPRRAHEVKPTKPALQAKHWFADALLKGVRLREQFHRDRVALAFPDYPRYRALIEESRSSLHQLRIEVLLVTADGTVEQPRLDDAGLAREVRR